MKKKLQRTSNLQRYGMTSDSAANWLAFGDFGAPFTRILAGQIRFEAFRLFVTKMTFDRDRSARWKVIGAVNVFIIMFAVGYDAHPGNFFDGTRDCKEKEISLTRSKK